MPVPVALTRKATSSTASAGGASATDWAAAGAAKASVARSASEAVTRPLAEAGGTSLSTMPGSLVAAGPSGKRSGVCGCAPAVYASYTAVLAMSRPEASTSLRVSPCGLVSRARHSRRRCTSPACRRVFGEPHALGLLGQLVEPEALVEHAQVALDRVHPEVELVATSLLDAGVARPRASTKGRASAARIARWRSVSAISPSGRGGDGAPGLVPGAGNSRRVAPTRTTSPSYRRRRPAIRSSLTNVPLRERPSSETAQSRPRTRSGSDA